MNWTSIRNVTNLADRELLFSASARQLGINYTGDEILFSRDSSPGAPATAAVKEPLLPDAASGAVVYIVVVIVVYGMSIVFLISAQIYRRPAKMIEDQQINKYLKEFQVFKERSSRDSYRNLKKAVAAKLRNSEHHRRNLLQQYSWNSNVHSCTGSGIELGKGGHPRETLLRSFSRTPIGYQTAGVNPGLTSSGKVVTSAGNVVTSPGNVATSHAGLGLQTLQCLRQPPYVNSPSQKCRDFTDQTDWTQPTNRYGVFSASSGSESEVPKRSKRRPSEIASRHVKNAYWAQESSIQGQESPNDCCTCRHLYVIDEQPTSSVTSLDSEPEMEDTSDPRENNRRHPKPLSLSIRRGKTAASSLFPSESSRLSNYCVNHSAKENSDDDIGHDVSAVFARSDDDNFDDVERRDDHERQTCQKRCGQDRMATSLTVRAEIYSQAVPLAGRRSQEHPDDQERWPVAENFGRKVSHDSCDVVDIRKGTEGLAATAAGDGRSGIGVAGREVGGGGSGGGGGGAGRGGRWGGRGRVRLQEGAREVRPVRDEKPRSRWGMGILIRRYANIFRSGRLGRGTEPYVSEERQRLEHSFRKPVQLIVEKCKEQPQHVSCV